MDMSKFKSMFLSEAGEHLRSMGSLLSDLEGSAADGDRIHELFRAAHSVKGMAASMGYERMAGLAHHLEDFLDHFRKTGEIGESAVDRLLAGVDLLEGLLEDLAADQPERDVSDFMAEGDDSLKEQAAEQRFYLRLTLHENVVSPSARLFLISRQFEELGKIENPNPSPEQIMGGDEFRALKLGLKTKLTQQEIEQAFQDYPEISEFKFSTEPPPQERRGEDRRRGDRRKGDRREQSISGGTVRVDTQLLDRFINLTGELITNRHMLQTALDDQAFRELNEGLGQLGKLVKSLHGQVLKVRMLPVGSITERLPRVVRDLCRKSGQDVALKIEGAEIELDRTILEEMADPLMHMVRNAVDHGIDVQGEVRVEVRRDRSHVLIKVQDNGKGIDPQKLRERALENELISSQQARVMSDSTALQLICLPGFSTNEQVTETSGRGVGMDVVKAAVEKLGGTLLIDSTLGEGTKMTMRLPLSVAIIRVLLVECDGKLLALPMTRILQTDQVERREIRSSGKKLMVQLKGETLPLLSLRKILGMPGAAAASQISIVVLELLGRKAALVVDRLVGHQEVFVKKLPQPFDELRGTNGGAILGDGQVVFILDVQSFLERRR